MKKNSFFAVMILIALQGLGQTKPGILKMDKYGAFTGDEWVTILLGGNKAAFEEKATITFPAFATLFEAFVKDSLKEQGVEAALDNSIVKPFPAGTKIRTQRNDGSWITRDVYPGEEGLYHVPTGIYWLSFKCGNLCSIKKTISNSGSGTGSTAGNVPGSSSGGGASSATATVTGGGSNGAPVITVVIPQIMGTGGTNNSGETEKKVISWEDGRAIGKQYINDINDQTLTTLAIADKINNLGSNNRGNGNCNTCPSGNTNTNINGGAIPYYQTGTVLVTGQTPQGGGNQTIITDRRSAAGEIAIGAAGTFLGNGALLALDRYVLNRGQNNNVRYNNTQTGNIRYGDVRWNRPGYSGDSRPLEEEGFSGDSGPRGTYNNTQQNRTGQYSNTHQ